jgi:hypothetical protein
MRAQAAAVAVLRPVLESADREHVENSNVTVGRGGGAAGSGSNGDGGMPGSYSSDNELVGRRMLRPAPQSTPPVVAHRRAIHRCGRGSLLTFTRLIARTVSF